MDNNLISYEISTPRGVFQTQPTQNFGFWSDKFAEEVYLPFHFFPGDPALGQAQRRDGRGNEFSVTPNAPGAKTLLVQALQTRNLYRIGIALHTFADTWAHQNFTGLREDWNTLDPRSVLPPVGHAQATRNPDVYEKIWEDRRLKAPVISNRERFRAAAGKIYRYLCTYNRRDFTQEEVVLEEWESLMASAKSGEDTTSRMAEFIIQYRMTPYDRLRWIKEAVLDLPGSPLQDEDLFQGFDKVLWLADELLYKKKFLKKEVLMGKDTVEHSHFYQWQTAAEQHRKTAQSLLDQTHPGWRSRV